MPVCTYVGRHCYQKKSFEKVLAWFARAKKSCVTREEIPSSRDAAETDGNHPSPMTGCLRLPKPGPLAKCQKCPHEEETERSSTASDLSLLLKVVALRIFRR